MEAASHATEAHGTNGDAATPPHADTTTHAGSAPPPRSKFAFVERLRTLRDDAEQKVRENPLAALGIAIGIGIMIGAAPRQALTRAAMFLGGQFLAGDLPNQSPTSTAFRDAS